MEPQEQQILPPRRRRRTDDALSPPMGNCSASFRFLFAMRICLGLSNDGALVITIY